MSGHLATITSAAENQFVSSIGDLRLYWLGGYQPPGSQEPAGGWTWITGEPFAFNNWDVTEPNNVDGVEFSIQYWYGFRDDA